MYIVKDNSVSANSKHVQIEPKLVQLGHILVQYVQKMGKAEQQFYTKSLILQNFDILKIQA